LRKSNRQKRSLRGTLANIVQKLTVPLVTHLRDNHILVARKVKSYEEMCDTAPKVVSEIDEWNNQRQEFSN